LFDHDAAVEGVLQLLVQELGLLRFSLLKDGDCGDISEGLGALHVHPSHFVRVAAEQVEGTYDGAPQPHGQGLDRAKAGGERLSGELGPTGADHGEVGSQDRGTAAVAVEARAFLGLQFEQFQHSHGLAGGSHHPQLAVGPGQHEPRRTDLEHFDTAVSQPGQELDYVEVGDQRVGQLD
jgi:hypothetical protein